MVKLNKIYTRTGDGGETSLVDGRRRQILAAPAFGEVDEANSVIGLARPTATARWTKCLPIQNDLFDLGATSQPGNRQAGAALPTSRYCV